MTGAVILVRSGTRKVWSAAFRLWRTDFRNGDEGVSRYFGSVGVRISGSPGFQADGILPNLPQDFIQ